MRSGTAWIGPASHRWRSSIFISCDCTSNSADEFLRTIEEITMVDATSTKRPPCRVARNSAIMGRRRCRGTSTKRPPCRVARKEELMIRAILKKGKIQPVDQLPEHWHEGQELIVQGCE